MKADEGRQVSRGGLKRGGEEVGGKPGKFLMGLRRFTGLGETELILPQVCATGSEMEDQAAMGKATIATRRGKGCLSRRRCCKSSATRRHNSA